MKKVALSFLALLAAGSMAFALDVKPVANISADGSTTFTYDLGGTWGVSNAANASIDLSLVGSVNGDGSDANASKGDQGGKISANFRVGLKSGSSDTTYDVYNLATTPVKSGTVKVTDKNSVVLNASLDYAKIVLGDLYIKIAGATDPKLGYTGDISYFDGLKNAIKLGDPAADVTTQGSKAGYEVGYTVKDVVKLTFALGESTGAVGATHDFEYSALAEVLAVKGLTLNVGYLGGTTGTTGGIAAKVGYDLGIVALTAAYDMVGTASGLTVEAVAPVIEGLKISVAALPLATTLDAIAKVNVGDKLLGVGTLDIGYQLTSSEVYADLELTKLVDGITAFVKVESKGSALNYAVGASATKLIENVTLSAELNSTKSTAGQLAVTAKIAL